MVKFEAMHKTQNRLFTLSYYQREKKLRKVTFRQIK